MSETFYLDPHTRQLLTGLLRDLTWMIPELDNVITRQTQYGDQYRDGGRTTDTMVPFDPVASDIAYDLHGTLTAWIDETTTQRQLPHPGHQRSQQATVWLALHINDLALCDTAEQAFDEIRDVTHRVAQVIDTKEPPEFIGPCQSTNPDTTCPGVYCRRGRNTTTCGTCGTTIDIPALREATAAVLADRLYDRKELRTALTVITRQPIARSTIDTWITRGRLESHSGRYRLDEALELLGTRHTA